LFTVSEKIQFWLLPDDIAFVAFYTDSGDSSCVHVLAADTDSCASWHWSMPWV